MQDQRVPRRTRLRAAAVLALFPATVLEARSAPFKSGTVADEATPPEWEVLPARALRTPSSPATPRRRWRAICWAKTDR